VSSVSTEEEECAALLRGENSQTPLHLLAECGSSTAAALVEDLVAAAPWAGPA